MKLTPEQQQIINAEIAKLCGWKRLNETSFYRWVDAAGNTHMATRNYCLSLDAMHEAVKQMHCGLRNSYNANLWEICGNEQGDFHPWSEWFYRALYATTEATPEQRAIAFLRVMKPSVLEELGL